MLTIAEHHELGNLRREVKVLRKALAKSIDAADQLKAANKQNKQLQACIKGNGMTEGGRVLNGFLALLRDSPGISRNAAMAEMRTTKIKKSTRLNLWYRARKIQAGDICL